MKKILLSVLGFMWCVISYCQQNDPMVDEFTYSPINVTKVVKDSTALSGANDNAPGTYSISQENSNAEFFRWCG